MLFYQQQWLPKKWQDWIPSKNELEKSKWWISKSDLSIENKKCLEIRYDVNPEKKSKAFFWE
jgi:hypothetical protein